MTARPALAVGLRVMVALLPACSSKHADVVVVGDSISALSEDTIDAVVDTSLDVDAESGATIADQREAVDDAIGERPRALVIELGTNDMSERTDQLTGEVTQILDEAASLPCVRWVTVALPGEAAGRFNQFLHEQDAARENLELVDWAAIAPGHPAWFQADNIHPNPSGQLVLAKAIADSIAACTS